jgi:hypothetical protein
MSTLQCGRRTGFATVLGASESHAFRKLQWSNNWLEGRMGRKREQRRILSSQAGSEPL